MRIKLRTYSFPPRVINAWNFIKILRVEPYIFLIAFQWGLKQTPFNQLTQDKICTQFYNTTDNYCRDLPSIDEHDNEHGHYKLRILSQSAQFGTYGSYATFLPGLFWAILIGAWIDRYVKARKILMLLNVLADVYLNLLVYMPTSVAGGMTGARIAMTHFMTSTTSPKLMAVRFMIFEACFTLAFPVGQAVGGYVLVKKPIFNTGEIRNFTLVFIIALIFDFVALFWVMIFINEKVAKKQEMKIEMKIRGNQGKLNKDQDSNIKLKSDMSKEDENVHPIKLLFNIKNIKDMVKTITKKRPNKGRVQIVLMIMSLSVFIAEMIGLMNVTPQFIQRVYRWQPDWTSYMSSISLVLIGSFTMTIIPVLSRVLHFPDVRLALLGYCIVFTTNIIKGTWLSENAYYVSMVIGAIGGTASIGTRSHLSKIVDRNEMGKIVSFMTTLDTLAPIISTTLFTMIFKNTIDSHPGTIYQVVSGMALIPILSMMWIDLYTERPIIEGEGHEAQGSDEQNNCEDKPKRIYHKHNDHAHQRSQHLKNEKEVQIEVSVFEGQADKKPKEIVTSL